MIPLRAHACLAAALLLAGCTGTSVEQRAAPELAALRRDGYRVAVLPFAVTAPADGFVTSSLAPVGDVLALEGGGDEPIQARIGAMLEADVVAWLQQSDFEVADPWHVRTVLAHAGIAPDQARDRDRATAIARMLDVDGLLYGDLRRWNRSYYLLQSVVDVGLDVELVDGPSRRELYRGSRNEQIGSGLTGGPTGYTSVATEPLIGLRGSTLRELTRSVARHAIADLNGGDLGSELGPSSPRLAWVALAREHDGPFRRGERVEVVALGSPDCDVRFDLGRLRVEVPMREAGRDGSGATTRATYVGHYVVDAVDAAQGLPLTCTIRRGTARRTTTTLYRWDGTIALAGDAGSTEPVAASRAGRP